MVKFLVGDYELNEMLKIQQRREIGYLVMVLKLLVIKDMSFCFLVAWQMNTPLTVCSLLTEHHQSHPIYQFLYC
jgi:hypothetical protein